jgi:hypothetical protein
MIRDADALFVCMLFLTNISVSSLNLFCYTRILPEDDNHHYNLSFVCLYLPRKLIKLYNTVLAVPYEDFIKCCSMNYFSYVRPPFYM